MFHVEQQAWAPEAFQHAFDVPRGTMQQLARYAELLEEWQRKMNLVGPATLPDLWGRHFADSAQLLRHAPGCNKWLDIGSGGGFPGMLLAILGVEQVSLVESIAKKARFLQALRDELGLQQQVSVLPQRIEQLPSLQVDVATARAVASLDRLLDWSLPHVRPGGLWLFPKGRSWEEEAGEARKRFSFDLSVLPSMTDAEARILRVCKLKRR